MDLWSYIIDSALVPQLIGTPSRLSYTSVFPWHFFVLLHISCGSHIYPPVCLMWQLCLKLRAMWQSYVYFVCPVTVIPFCHVTVLISTFVVHPCVMWQSYVWLCVTCHSYICVSCDRMMNTFLCHVTEFYILCVSCDRVLPTLSVTWQLEFCLL